MFSKVKGRYYDTSQTKQRFSIKKFKIGAASVLVGTLFAVFASQIQVYANENTVAEPTVEVHASQAEQETTAPATPEVEAPAQAEQSPVEEKTAEVKTEATDQEAPVASDYIGNVNAEDVTTTSGSDNSLNSNNSAESTNNFNDLKETASEKDVTISPIITTRSVDSAVENADTYEDKPNVRLSRSVDVSDRESGSQEFPLKSAEYEDKAHLIVTKNNMVDHFEVRGSAYGDDQNPIVLTNDIPSQAGSLLLNKKIDMNESFRLEGRLNLGNKYEGHQVDGKSGGDGISFVFTATEPGVIGLSGASIGLGGIPNSFGFKLDTWHNTSTPNANQKAGADPKFSGYQNGAFGAFYSTDSNGKANTLLQDAKRLNSQPLNNEFKDVIVSFDGQSKILEVTYAGQTFTKNIQSYLDNSRKTTKQDKGREELSFALFASTGTGTNLQQFDLTSFDYSSGGSYIKLLYVDDSTGNVIKEKLYNGLTYQSLDLSDKLMLPDYTFKRTNAPTAAGYQDSNTINFKSGIQTVTYTYKKVEKEELQKLVDNDSNLKLTDIYVNADKTKQMAYDDSIKKGQEVLSDSFTTQDRVDDAVMIITDSINALRVSAAEAAVKAAEDAAQAGKDKKAEVEADGVVNPAEKSAVDGLNDVTTEKKGTATPLVDSLPEGPVKEALKARLDQVTTSEVTVNDADSNGKPDSQDAAEAINMQPSYTKEALPNTGEESSIVSMLGVVTLLGTLGTVAHKRRRKEK